MNRPVDASDAYPWILFLNPEIHTDEYKLVKNSGLDTYILVQDMRVAPPERPSWLSVLPTLVDTKARTGYQGPACLEKLVTIDLPPEHARRLQKMIARKSRSLYQNSDAFTD